MIPQIFAMKRNKSNKVFFFLENHTSIKFLRKSETYHAHCFKVRRLKVIILVKKQHLAIFE